jgi:MFS family permease
MTLVARPWLVLSAVLVGTFMAVLDVAIVNVAIPSIREDLNATFGEVQLVISAYTLTCASLLVTGGCLGALFGRKRMFVLGLALFSAASAACGLAPSSGVLIAARALQGVGGALLYPGAGDRAGHFRWRRPHSSTGHFRHSGGLGGGR